MRIQYRFGRLSLREANRNRQVRVAGLEISRKSALHRHTLEYYTIRLRVKEKS